MSETKSPCKGLTRRSFLKTTAAVAGAAAAVAGGSTLTALADEEKSQSSDVREYLCKCTGTCLGHCSHKVTVRDGKAVNIEKYELPDPQWQSICQRGLTQLNRLYDPNRIKYPMRRVEGTARGAGEWERITWDEAFDEITTKWKAYREEFGNESIAFLTNGGNLRPDVNSYCTRLQQYMGAVKIYASYDGNGNYNMPRLFGYGAWLRGNDWRSVRDAKNLVFWAFNPTDSTTIRMRWVMDAKERGARFITIDPTYTTIASKSDDFYPIRPGSDGYLALAICNDLISNDLHDKEALRTKTVAPFLVKESTGTFLRLSDLGQVEEGSKEDAIVVRTEAGDFVPASMESNPVLSCDCEVNGEKLRTAFDYLVDRVKDYNYEQAAEYRDLSMEQILEIAQIFKEQPTTVCSSYACDKYANAMSFYTSMLTLLMVSGNLGKDGAGYVDGYCSMPLGFAGGNYSNIPNVPAPQGGPTIWDVYVYEHYVEGKDYTQAGYKSGMFTEASGELHPLKTPLKSLYIWGTNTLMTEACRKKWIEFFDSLEFIVCMDVRMSETACYADLALPAPHYYELESFDNNTPFTCINEAAVEPAFESMGDLEVVNELGRRMGYVEAFSMTRDEFNRNAFADETSAAFGITWDTLKEQKAQFAFTPDVFIQGKDSAYVTSTGRAQFFIEGVRPVPDQGQTYPEWDWKKEALPYWEPPAEAWYENPLHEKYPLSFYQKHGKFKVHSMYTDTATLLEIEPEPILYLPEKDAADRGIVTGDIVRAFNDRGYVVARCHVHNGMKPGTSCMAHGWEKGQYIDGHMQDLTPDFYSKYIGAPCFFDTLIQVEKYEGGAR